MGTYNIHAGHGNSNGKGCGAVGILDESTEARKVKDELIRLLKYYGNTVYDCTFNGNANQNAILGAIVSLCNLHKADLDISIHLNSGRNDSTGDNSTGGVEVFGYDNGTSEIGNKICENISSMLGIRNRGFKISNSLYVLKETSAPAILIECCFVDDKDDADKWKPDICASAIAQAIFSVYNQNGGNDSTINCTIKHTERPTVGIPKQNLDVNVYYKVYAGGKWYEEVKNLEDYAGNGRNAIRAIAIRVDKGNIRYRIHVRNGNWYSYVTGYNPSDNINGYAGDCRNDIDAIEVYYITPEGYTYKKAKYRLAPLNGNYYPWQTDNDKGNGMDGYAGSYGVSFGKFQIIIE